MRRKYPQERQCFKNLFLADAEQMNHITDFLSAYGNVWTHQNASADDRQHCAKDYSSLVHLQFIDHVEHAITAVRLQQLHDVWMFQHMAY